MRLVTLAALLLVATTAHAAEIKRDLQGFALGMTADEIWAKADGKCAESDAVASSMLACALSENELRVYFTSAIDPPRATAIALTFCTYDSDEAVIDKLEAQFNTQIDYSPGFNAGKGSVSPTVAINTWVELCNLQGARLWAVTITDLELLSEDGAEKQRIDSLKHKTPSF